MNMGLPEDSWNQSVIKQGGHFLQSREWAQFQLALGRTVLWDLGENWSWLATVHQTMKVSYLNCAYGPTVDKGALEECLERLVDAAQRSNAVFVRVEPVGLVNDQDLPKSKYMTTKIEEHEPALTSILDLTREESDLRSGLSTGHRSRINGAERKGIMMREGSLDDAGTFNDLIRLTAKRNSIRVYEPDYFFSMLKVLMPLGVAKLYLAEVESVVVSAYIIYCWNDVWYYAHAANHPDFLKVNAGVALLWKVIIDAKNAGATTFDFWGVVPPEQTSGPKVGYSNFKRGFGGYDKAYAGTWDIGVNLGVYKLFKFGREATRYARRTLRG